MTNLNTLPPPCVNLVSTIVVLRISSVLSNYQLVRCWDMTTTENQVNQNILQIGNRRNYNFWWFKHFLHLQGCTEKFKGGEPEGECLRGSAKYWEKYTLFVKFLTKCTKRGGRRTITLSLWTYQTCATIISFSFHSTFIWTLIDDDIYMAYGIDFNNQQSVQRRSLLHLFWNPVLQVCSK